MATDFTGFTYGGVHSSTFGIYSVTKGNRYKAPFSGKVSVRSLSAPGREGEYYFDTDIGKKTITLNCMVVDITGEQLRGLQFWMRPGRVEQLTIDGMTYQYQLATVNKEITFNFVPFEGVNDTTVFSGSFDITMVAHDPYAHSDFYAQDAFTFDDADWYWESGVLFESWSPNITITSPSDGDEFILYNGGNAASFCTVEIDGTWTVDEDLIITNITTGQEFSLKYAATGVDDLSIENFKVDGTYARTFTINGSAVETLKNSIHSGDYIKILGTGYRTVQDMSFTNGSTTVTTTGTFDDSIVGRCLFINTGVGTGESCYVASKESSTSITLRSAFGGTADTYSAVIADGNLMSITGSSGSTLAIDEVRFIYQYTYY